MEKGGLGASRKCSHTDTGQLPKEGKGESSPQAPRVEQKLSQSLSVWTGKRAKLARQGGAHL